MRSRDIYNRIYPEETVRNTTQHGERLWYLMRIVGHNSDILVQNVLDALLRKQMPDCPTADNAAVLPTKVMQEKIDRALQGLLPFDLEDYLYPKAILEDINRSRRKERICPLLTGYVFCKADERLLVKLVNSIPNFIFCYPRPINDIKRVIIPDGEMVNFINALRSAAADYDARIISFEEARETLREDTTVRIEGGVLHDVIGVIGKNKDRNHLFITLGGIYTLDIKLKRTDKKVPLAGKTAKTKAADCQGLLLDV